jgi:hypothetical protein
MHVLRGAVRRVDLDESVRGNPMGDVQRRNVGVSGGALFTAVVLTSYRLAGSIP